jgi:signal transduction histidine kinase
MRSLKTRLVAVFLLLALALAATFFFGMQKAFSHGWRDAARPLLADYVDRLVTDLGTPPSVARAQALVQRLPVSVRIEGPQVQWQSHAQMDDWREHEYGDGPRPDWLTRNTADGHRVTLGLAPDVWSGRSRFVGWATLGALLALTALAWAWVRRMLKPLDDIGAGAARFGTGDFSAPIAVRRQDELGQLATGVNQMASSIHSMLEAKRALLLAISHELRSPLTRARINAELLPDADSTSDAGQRRAALLRDLQEMAALISDLLESERLGDGHRALHKEPVDPSALLNEVLAGLTERYALAASIHPKGSASQPQAVLVLADRTRLALLLRNLLDNALRHGAVAEGAQAPEVTVTVEPTQWCLCIRDFGPGVDAAALPRLTEAFYRPDAARSRDTGGVGLGLYLCRLVAEAHGGSLTLTNAHPGLRAKLVLPRGQA